MWPPRAHRIATEDMTIGGLPVPVGTSVAMLLAAAHRDPAAVGDPDRFDPHRTEIPHLAFGMGPHFCLGAPLARLEGRLALTRLAQRVDGLTLQVERPPYRQLVNLRGPATIPVSYHGVADHSLPWP